jgi:hypothetical protein
LDSSGESGELAVGLDAKEASISIDSLNPSEFPWESGEVAVGLDAKEASISIDSLNPSEFPWESGELAVGLFGEDGTCGRTQFAKNASPFFPFSLPP